MQQFKHILFMIGCVLLTQCFETSFQQTDNKIKVLRALSSEVIMARYESFIGKSDDLSQAIASLCNEPSESSLLRAQEAWWSAREDWKRAEIIKFGPVKSF